MNDSEWFKLGSISQTKLMIDRLNQLTVKNRDAIRQHQLKQRIYNYATRSPKPQHDRTDLA
jgi:hypothetical protein